MQKVTEVSVFNEAKEPVLTIRVTGFNQFKVPNKLELFNPNNPLQVLTLDASAIDGLFEALELVTG